MSLSRLDHVLEGYEAKLAGIEELSPNLSEAQIIDVLVVRDEVRFALTDKTKDPTASLLALTKLDKRLKKQAGIITAAIELANWRASLNPPKEAWWWSLETIAPPHIAKRFDWVWSALAILCFTISFSLIADISTRFLSGGPDTLGTFAVFSQAVLTLLAAGGTLTKAGQMTIEHILASLKIPSHFRQEMKLGFAFVLLLVLIGLHRSLPAIAVNYNNAGLEHQHTGELTSAKFNYERALKLNPDYVNAHYNLGLLYEDLGDFENARTEYLVAVGGGLDAAYNNLARLYILDGNYTAAIPLLLSGLELAKDEYVRYDMLKNLGWARLEQSRFAEAETRLRTAITLKDDKAPGHCLLAQALEGQGNLDGALSEWDSCLKYANGYNPDEDVWINLARKSLTNTGDE